MVSEAAMPFVSAPLLLGASVDCESGVDVPGVDGCEGDLAGASCARADCDDEREKVFARGARCVSLSSTNIANQHCPSNLNETCGSSNGYYMHRSVDLLFVSFHDILMSYDYESHSDCIRPDDGSEIDVPGYESIDWL